MAQLTIQELLERVVAQGIGSPCDYLLAVVDWISGHCRRTRRSDGGPNEANRHN
jgi:hypothetical protein